LTNGLGPTERNKNVDSKELADRFAAAEAMSCLSSLVILPSNAEELIRMSNLNLNFAETKIENGIQIEPDKNKKPQTKIRGKTKPKGAHESTNRKREKHRTKSKGKTECRTEPGGGNSASVVNTTMTKLAQNPNIINSTSIPIPIQMALLSKLKTHQLGNSKRPTNNDQLELTPSENLILKLPLLLSGGNDPTEKVTTVWNTEEKCPVMTDSVEFTQSTVDRIIHQQLPSKFDSLESALPLKKRRILAYQESQETMSEDLGNGSNELATDGLEKPIRDHENTGDNNMEQNFNVNF